MQNRGKRFYAGLAVFYSGALGLLILNNGIINNPVQALFPVLTGLFGISTLLMSLNSRVDVPPQFLSWTPTPALKGIGVGSLAGLLAGLLPSIGSSQSATVVQEIFGKGDER